MEQVYKLYKMKTVSSCGILKTMYDNDVKGVIYCYLERKNYKVLKFRTNNSFYFKIRSVLQ